MADVEVASGFFTATPYRSLFWQRWSGPGSRRPLILLHGGGEHLGRHAELAVRLVQQGYEVDAFDLPGHGQSPGKRGHIRRFMEFVASLRTFVEQVRQRHGGAAPILFGHSLGGLVGSVYAADHGESIRGLVLSSPLWGLSVRVPWWKHAVAYSLVWVWPSLTLRRPAVGGNALSHDPQIEADYLRDPLVHFRASLRLYVDCRREMEQLPETLSRLSAPSLVLQAGDDRIASAPAVRTLFPSIGSANKRLVIYPGYSHEIFHELGKEAVYRDLLEWLAACP